MATVAMFATACTEGGEEIDGQQPTGGPISVSQGRVNVDCVGGECELTVNAKCSWAATCSANWITIQTPEGIAGKEPLRFNVARNTESSERKTTITLKNDNYNLIQEIYVIQSAFTPIIKVVESISLEFSACEKFVEVTSNVDYTVTDDADWLTCAIVEGGINLLATTNDTLDSRSAQMTITVKENPVALSINVTVVQTPPKDSDFVIYYTSSDGNIVEPYIEGFGANIISNKYEDGQGTLLFDAPVTSIGYSAFENCRSLTSVTIPDSVTSIGNEAFRYCSSLTSITIPDSVTEIGGGAFSRCASLTSFYGKFSSEDKCCLIVDSTLVAFAPACGKTSYIIPDSVTEIGYSAFRGCDSLTNVTIPDSVTSIGEYAFYDCNSLTSVIIPDGVTEIGDNAFWRCTSLTSVTIPDNVTSIGEYAFYGCTSLTSIAIPDSVTSIGAAAFSGCASLTSFYGKFSSEDKCCLIVDSTLVAFAPACGKTSYIIPDSVTEIGNYAFSGCDSLTSVIIPDSVTSIGYDAFEYCTLLTSITIPDSVTSIGIYAFECCSSLTSVTIPDRVTTIRTMTFYYCTSLTSVTISDSVTSIGERAFYYCTALKEVYCKPTTPPAGDDSMFGYNASGRKIYVPRASVDAYKSASWWSNYSSRIVGYDF